LLSRKFTAADVLALDLPTEVETLGGAKLTIETVDGDVIVGGQKVVQPNIMAANGVIHGIDGVITNTDGSTATTASTATDSEDSLDTIVEILVADPDYSTLVAAVSVAADTQGNKLVDDLADAGPFTVGTSPLCRPPISN
jgi:uncharacterized surface protein with fasciclin (FAS1) repeats